MRGVIEFYFLSMAPLKHALQWTIPHFLLFQFLFRESLSDFVFPCLFWTEIISEWTNWLSVLFSFVFSVHGFHSDPNPRFDSELVLYWIFYPLFLNSFFFGSNSLSTVFVFWWSVPPSLIFWVKSYRFWWLVPPEWIRPFS